MCNAYGYSAPVSRLIDTFAELKIPLRFEGGAIPNLEPRDWIRPTNKAPVIRPIDAHNPGEALEFGELRWWLVPFFHKGAVKDWKAMCTNAKAETIDTAAAFRDAFRRRRCLVPASHFFEWTPLDPAKPKGPKRKWRVHTTGSEVFFFAGLWDECQPSDHHGPLRSFTLATCAPGEDMKPYHHRQPVILSAEGAMEWLRLDGPGKALLQPGAHGTLKLVEDLAVEPA
jgi:putative SOS response-associated peptidase YedK